MRSFTLRSLLVGLALLLPAAARAQVGSTTDIITGTVRGPGNTPLLNATVEVTSIETGVTRKKNTNDKGQYTILFPDGGGQYRVTIRYLGMAPQQFTLARQSDEDRLVGNVVMSQVPTQLQGVVVQANRAPREDDRPTPGSVARSLTGEQLARLPIDPSDPNAIALLAPGVVSIGGSDTTSAGFSVAGQRPDQNNITLDGLSFGSGGVPQEAVRSTRVVTSTYDIARGQFTGGLVQTTTRGGTNQLTGSVSYSLRDPHLEFYDNPDTVSSTFGQGYTQHQLSGGLGGPIVKDKLFWFGSAQVRRRLDPLQSLLGADPTTLQRLGANPDSAARFLSTLGAFGIPLTVSAVPSDRLNDNLTALARFDYHVSDDHTLMFRANYSGGLQQGYRISTLGAPSHGGDSHNWSAGSMVTLSSVLGNFLNEMRAYYNHDDRSANPYLFLPEGRVRLTSDLPGGTTGVSTLDFGGNSGLPTEGLNNQFEGSDELSWLSPGGAHRWKLGGLLNLSDFSTISATNRFGSFSFNSLADFISNRPATFTRSLTSRDRTGNMVNDALYFGDTWRYSRALQLTLGVRAEHSAFLKHADYNPEVEQLFGRRTDNFPTEFHVSPRVGFTWTISSAPQRGQGGQGGQGGGGEAGGGRGGFGGGRGGGGGPGGGGFGVGTPPPATIIIRGGIGEFRGRAPTQLFSSAIDATGLPSGQQQLVCIGAGVPIPDWTSYALDPLTIPTQCAGGAGGTTPNANTRPTVTMFDPNFGAPRSWRGSLGATRRLADRYGLNVDVSYALGTNLYAVRDANLNTTPQFTLATEGNRPVYVPMSSIVPTTGATTVLASRVYPQFAQVLDVNSALHSHTAQATVGLSGVFSFTNLIWNLSYTFMRSTDQTSFSGSGGGFSSFGGTSTFGGFGGSTTAGNPNVIEWGTSDLERRHSLVGTLNWIANPWIDVTSVIRVSAGAPYTPRVGGDINGDGARNDRAFIYDPAHAPDTAIANGMQRLLSGSSANVRACLQAQLGQIAGRNSCSSAWFPTLDFQANLRPYLGASLQRRLTFNVSLVNPLAGLDQLFHGANNLHGWGQQSRPDPTLLYVRGFDPTSQRFVYQVNERFGDTQAARNAIRTPFMIGIQARLQLGPDRQREMLLNMLQGLNGNRGGFANGPGGGGGRGGGGRGGLDIRGMVDRFAPNPAKQILTYSDSLKLSDDQVKKLTTLGDSIQTQTDSLAKQLLDQATNAVNRGGDMQTIFRDLQPKLDEARNHYLAGLKAAQSILTPEQWAKLPDNVRNPPAPRMPGQPGGQRRPPE